MSTISNVCNCFFFQLYIIIVNETSSIIVYSVTFVFDLGGHHNVYRLSFNQLPNPG